MLWGKLCWTFEYSDEKYYFEFDSQFYKREIERMRFKLDKTKLKLQPDYIIDPE